MRRSLRLAPCFILGIPLLLAATGCDTDVPGDTPESTEHEGEAVGDEGPVGEGSEAIINGSFDAENDAVCALVVSFGGDLSPFCTGTIIKKTGATAYAISAAHCIDEGYSPDYLLCADRYQDCNNGGDCRIYPVTNAQMHPQYDGGPVYDITMITLTNASDAAVVPVAGAADGLADGAPIEFSGYGVVNGYNQTPSNQRNHSFSIVGTLYQDAIEAPQSHSGQYGGTCFGDSGGPVFSGTGANKRLVGITSQGDQYCDEVGYYARTQFLWEHIRSYIGDEDVPTCQSCTDDARLGVCAQQYADCAANADCAAYQVCRNGCGSDTACIQGCVAQHPTGAPIHDAFLYCGYCTACASLCNPGAFCDNPPPTTAAAGGVTTGTGAGTGTGSGSGGAGGGAEDDDDGDDDDGRKDGGDDETSGDDGGETVTTCACEVPGAAPNASNPAWLVGLALGVSLVGRRRRRR